MNPTWNANARTNGWNDPCNNPNAKQAAEQKRRWQAKIPKNIASNKGND
jgi:hypothetical protein